MSKLHFIRGQVAPNVEMRNLEEAFARGDINEKLYDAMMDELMEISNDSSSATRSWERDDG